MIRLALVCSFASVLAVHSATAQTLPLEPGRSIEFSTDEGSWISLDVSPNGQTIVFDLLGDLYTLPIAGGTARALTNGMAFDAQPRFSPDGSRIVFVSDRDGGENVWIMSLDGSDTTQLTTGKGDRYISPEWTPDGTYIVASKGGTSKPWMYHVDGGSGVELVREPQNIKLLGAAFGPDPRFIWFAERRGSSTYNAQFPLYQLVMYDRESGERHTRTARYGSAFRPTLSPDGHWLVYGSRQDEDTGLRIRDLTTGEERWLAYPVQRDDQESRAVLDVLPGYTFTPDSRAVIASFNGRIWRMGIDGSNAVEIPFRADVALDIGPRVDFSYPIEDTPTFVAQQIRDAVPSPDGRRLAFVVMDRLWITDYPDGTPARVTRGNTAEHHPSWSPDGSALAFVTWSDDQGGHINRVTASRGNNARRLTNRAGYYTHPAWSPDGQRVVAIRTPALNFQQAIARGGSANGSDIVYVATSGGDVTVVAPAGGLARPHFTRDTERIFAFSSDSGLISMRWDGSDRKGHLRVTGGRTPGADNPLRASLILMAPRGDRALAQIVNDLYVVTVPPLPGRTPTVSVANAANAAFPAKKITDIGAQFPTWSSDGQNVHWSIGAAHFTYDLTAAEAIDATRSAETAADEPFDILTPEQADSVDAVERERGYRPLEKHIAIDVERDIPRGLVVLRGARVITMRGDEIIPEADLVVRDSRIQSVARRGAVPVPDGADVIDVSEMTIIPGFVDTHAHLRPMYEIHKSQVWSYLANLAFGVTTTRDPQTATTDVLSYADMVTAGRILGPRIYSTGPGVFQSELIRDQDHANDVLRRYSQYYNTKTIKMYVAGNREQRQWIIRAAREHRIMPTTEGALDFKNNLINTIDGYPGMEHSIPIYPLYRDVVRLFAETGRVYTPTLLVAYGGPWAENYYYANEEVHDNQKLQRFTPHDELDSKSLRRGGGSGQAGWFRREQHVFDNHARFVRDLIAAGGRAGVGSHGQLQGLGYHWELWAMQSGGLSEHDALRVATLHGAEAIGLDRDLGSIERGKLADLIVLEENPLDHIRNTRSIRYVMKNGRLYEGDTLNELWPRQLPLGPLPWEMEWR